MAEPEREVVAEAGSGLRRKDVLSLRDMDRAEMEAVLRNATAFKDVMARPIKKVPTLRGKSVVTLFYEASTRTRTSFELAAKVMSADAINIAASSSSVVKGRGAPEVRRTASVRQAPARRAWMRTRPLRGAMPQTSTFPPLRRSATRGKRNAVRAGFGAPSRK